jgi:hypothetical protein
MFGESFLGFIGNEGETAPKTLEKVEAAFTSLGHGTYSSVKPLTIDLLRASADLHTIPGWIDKNLANLKYNPKSQSQSFQANSDSWDPVTKLVEFPTNEFEKVTDSLKKIIAFHIRDSTIVKGGLSASSLSGESVARTQAVPLQEALSFQRVQETEASNSWIAPSVSFPSAGTVERQFVAMKPSGLEIQKTPDGVNRNRTEAKLMLAVFGDGQIYLGAPNLVTPIEKAAQFFQARKAKEEELQTPIIALLEMTIEYDEKNSDHLITSITQSFPTEKQEGSSSSQIGVTSALRAYGLALTTGLELRNLMFN